MRDSAHYHYRGSIVWAALLRKLERERRNAKAPIIASGDQSTACCANFVDVA